MGEGGGKVRATAVMVVTEGGDGCCTFCCLRQQGRGSLFWRDSANGRDVHGGNIYGDDGDGVTGGEDGGNNIMNGGNDGSRGGE